MPKDITPRSSPAKRAWGFSSSPRKLNPFEVQDRALWRSSNVHINSNIIKTDAKANYRLNDVDLLPLKFEERPCRPRPGVRDRYMHLYREREVELIAWEKHGGPEGFENFLRNKLQQHRATKAKKEFVLPNTYDLSHPPSPSPITLARISRDLHFPEIPTRKLLQIKIEMEAKGERWLWAAINRCISDSNSDVSWVEREDMVSRAYEQLSEDYPERASSPPPSDSSSFEALNDVLNQLPVGCNEEEEGEPVHGGHDEEDDEQQDDDEEDVSEVNDEEAVEEEEENDDDESIEWGEPYKAAVKKCLRQVRREHDRDGLLKARWLVYDKYVEFKIGGLNYDRQEGEFIWEDTAKFWLY